jgi:uncharacterized protein (DUF2147 family)
LIQINSMKASFFFILASISFSLANAQNSDLIVGKWLSADGDGKIEIYKKGDVYYGKLIWLKEPNETNGKPKIDDENPDPSKRNTPLLNLVILKNFTFEDGFWQGGTIYDPKNGKTYKCEMWTEGKNTLRIRGYVAFLHRTESWTRVN